MSCQFFTRTEENIETTTGYPDFDTIANDGVFGKITFSEDNVPDLSTKPTTKAISDNGLYLAIALADNLKVYSGEKDFSSLIMEIPLEKPLYSMKFSNTGRFLQTFQQFSVNKEENEGLKNCTVYDVINNKKLYEYTNKSLDNWHLTFNKNDTFVIQLSNNRKSMKFIKLNKNCDNLSFDLSENIYNTFNFANSIENFEISPNCNQPPIIATFTPVKSGKPASLQIWVTSSLPSKKPIEQAVNTKTFFAVDSCIFYWNAKGTTVLGKTSTNFNSNSYNGENKLYLLSHISNQALLLTSSKDSGPIHDINWNVDGLSFAVNFGYMPSKTVFYNTKGDVIKQMEPDKKNTILHSPNGKYVLIAGWGNLAGAVDIFDITDNYKKIVSFEQSNINFVEWSPSGEFLLMAITSPRLRVDNVIKILHFSGKLVYIKEFKELLQCGWRLKDLKSKDPVYNFKDAKLKIHHHFTVTQYKIKNAGKEPNPGAPKKPATSWRASRGKVSSGLFEPGASSGSGSFAAKRQANAKKTVPGAVPGAVPVSNKKTPTNKNGGETKKEELTPEKKVLRNLLKVYHGIQKIKEKQAAGERLELTQISKLEREEFVIKELKAVGWNGSDTA